MAVEVKKEIELEIAHVLFTDIVGYSKLPIHQQRLATFPLASPPCDISQQFRNPAAIREKRPTRVERREPVTREFENRRKSAAVIRRRPGNGRGRVAT
jgi:hypothetical protein